MASYSEFTRLVSNFAPNVPPFVVERAAQQCVQDFLGRTVELQEVIEIETIIGERTYKLFPTTSDTFVNEVLGAKDAKDNALGYTQVSDLLTLARIPDKVETIKVQTALCLTIESTEIPDHLYQRHSNLFRNGVIAILKSQIGTEWYSPNETSYYMSLYEAGVNQARIAHYTQNTYTTMQIPRFDL